MALQLDAESADEEQQSVHLRITGFNILLPNFINIFKVRDLILCFELNILDDLKIVEYRNFSLMQQKQFLFCVFFLTIIIILQLIMGMFDTYRILAIIYIMFIILAIVYSS